MTPTSIGTPVISNIVKGPTGASFDFAAVPKAAQYVITRYKNGVAQTPTITRLPSDPKAVSFTLAAPTDADAYSWQVVAVTAGGVQSVPGTTGSLKVGVPLAPTGVTATGGVGKGDLQFRCASAACMCLAQVVLWLCLLCLPACHPAYPPVLALLCAAVALT